jgi:hypothetical protein
MSHIVGHSWEAIQRAQQGGRLHERIDTSKPAASTATAEDLALLNQYGTIAALKEAGLWGVADRLERNS